MVVSIILIRCKISITFGKVLVANAVKAARTYFFLLRAAPGAGIKNKECTKWKKWFVLSVGMSMIPR